MKDKSSIEHIFENAFEDFSQAPSPKSWDVVSANIKRHNFWRLKNRPVNVYTIALALVIGASVLYYAGIGKNTHPTETNIFIADSVVKEDVTINKAPIVVDKKENTIVTDNNEVNSVVQPENTNIDLIESGTVENKKIEPLDKDVRISNMTQNKVVIEEDKVEPFYADFVVTENRGCAPFSVQLLNTSVNAASYKWSIDNDSYSYDNQVDVKFEEAGKYSISLTALSAGGKKSVMYDTIYVYASPKVKFTVDSDVIIPNKEVIFETVAYDAVNYMWYIDDKLISTDVEMSYTFANISSHKITLTAQDEHACLSKYTMDVVVENDFYVNFPNALQPDENGSSNGYFSADDHDCRVFHPKTRGIKEYTLQIYNKSGELLFTTTDLNRGWDGYYKDDIVPSGVYIYRSHGEYIDGTKYNIAGDITVIRTK